MRANQVFEEMGEETVSEVADRLLNTRYDELGGMTPLEYQTHVGPAQYFTCGQPAECDRKRESLAILLAKDRVNPALMSLESTRISFDRSHRPLRRSRNIGT